jgi:hypothetical protein
MRLTARQVQDIRLAAHRVRGDGARVRVSGSRVDDSRRGGNIDLFFGTERSLDNRAVAICRLGAALTLLLGDRKIDIVLEDAATPPAPIFEIAQRTGVLLL